MAAYDFSEGLAALRVDKKHFHSKGEDSVRYAFPIPKLKAGRGGEKTGRDREPN